MDATCVVLPVDQYEWTLDLTDRWKKEEFPDAPASFEHTWSPADCGDDENIRFKLKVRRDLEADTVEKNFFVPGSAALETAPGAPVRIDVGTHLATGGSSRGSIVVNDAPIRVIDNTAPVRMNVRGRRGKNTITGVVVAGAGEPGTWRFALETIVPGSLDVVSGNVLAREPGAVVFRLSGHAGERVELTFVPRE